MENKSSFICQYSVLTIILDWGMVFYGKLANIKDYNNSLFGFWGEDIHECFGISFIKRDFCSLESQWKKKENLFRFLGFQNRVFSWTLMYFVILKASNENVSSWDAAPMDAGYKTEPCKLVCNVFFFFSFRFLFKLHFCSIVLVVFLVCCVHDHYNF